MKEKFLVGELAKLFNISTDTLRHYDKLDILKPQSNPKTKYRYYDVQSVFKLSRILFLKNLDIALSDIYIYMKNKNRTNLLEILKKKNEELDLKIHHFLNLKHKIQLKIDLLEHYEHDLNKISIKKMPKRYGVFLDIANLNDEAEIKQAFIRSEKYLTISSWLIEGQVYTSLMKSDIDKGVFNRFRYFIEVDAIELENHREIEIIPENEYVCLTVLGPYSDMVNHYKTLVKWISENGYNIIGDSIEKNIIDYGTTDSEIDYVSEIQIPISKSVY